MAASVVLESVQGYLMPFLCDEMGYVWCLSCCRRLHKEPNLGMDDPSSSAEAVRRKMISRHGLDEDDWGCDGCGKPSEEWEVESIRATAEVEYFRAKIF